MRLLRALSAALILVTSLALVVVDHGPARAASVGEAEDEAADALDRSNQAQSLVSAVGAHRAGLEADLAAAFVRLSEVNSELTRVSVRLDELRQALATAETDMSLLDEELTDQAVGAYVRAVAMPASSLIGTSDAETALVATNSIASTLSNDKAVLADLTVKRRALRDLTDEYTADRERVATLQMEADAAADEVETLLAEADAAVAAAVAAARRADADHRAALDEVAAARAREEERQRQAEREDPPPAPPQPTTTTTTIPSDTPTTTTTPAPPPPPQPGGPFPPAVERWRPLVGVYFPADRVDEALSVLHCESGGEPNAHNPYSGAGGLFQFLPPTWATASSQAGFSGSSVFDAEANIGTAGWLSSYYVSRGSSAWAPWTCKP